MSFAERQMVLPAAAQRLCANSSEEAKKSIAQEMIVLKLAWR